MFLNAFKRISSAGVPSLQLVRRLDIITADGGGLYLNGSALAAAELTYIDGITAIGTAQASKAVVLDASKGIVGLGVTSVGTSNTSGVVLTASVTNALQVVAEDGGVSIASGNPKAIKGRFFVKANPGDCTIDGVLGQVKINTSITCSADYTNGIRGYLELVGGNTVNTGGANANTGCGGHGVHGWITAADNLTIAASHYLCGVASRLSVTAAKTITTTGVLAAYGVFADDNLGGATPTQVWGYGLYIPNSVVTTGAYIGTATTGLHLAGTYTEGISIEAATSSITFGTGDGKIVDAAASLSIYGGNTSGDALVLYGSSADAGQKITITGASGTAVTGTFAVGADAAGADVTFYGAVTTYKTWWDANGDTNGTWYFGADTKGVDVFTYGATSGVYSQWDQSADSLNFMGASRLYFGTSTSSRNTYTTAVDIVQLFTNCTATSGICTGLDFEHAIGYQGSTSLQGTGIRGVLRVLSGTTHTAGYNDAAAGYILMAGTINGTGTYYGTRGVIMDGGTWTACNAVYAVCAEYKNNSAVTAGSTGCIRALNLSDKTIDDAMFVYNGTAITNLFNIESASLAPVSAGGTGDITFAGAYLKIAVKIAGEAYYLVASKLA